MDLKKFAEEINECYGEPFLPEGFVKASVSNHGTLWLGIGDRDGEFDEDGKRDSSGTAVGKGRQWDIQHLPESSFVHITPWLKVELGVGERYRCDMCGSLLKKDSVIHVCPRAEGHGFSFMQFCDRCYQEDMERELKEELNRIRRGRKKERQIEQDSIEQIAN